MQRIFRWPFLYLDRTPMYSVVLQVLLVIYAIAIVGSVFGYIGFTSIELLSSGAVIMATALVVNYICALATKVPLQYYSSAITALILILLIMPSTVAIDLFYAAAITALAIASKYVLVYKRQHLINPVAAGLVVGALLGFGGGSWWVASPFLFVPIVIGGLLVAKKIKRLDMVAVFIAGTFILFMMHSWQEPVATSSLITTFFLSYPFVFLAFFMLTEPFTMPSQKSPRYGYALVVAGATAIPSVGWLSVSPELALVIGNVALAPWAQRQKLMLTLSEVRKISSTIYECTFSKPKDFTFKAGQYLEWMVPHKKADARGTRRYFTILSAPADPELKLAFKLPAAASSYKTALVSQGIGQPVIASQLAGDFIMPTDPSKKIGWIAGGIGVTPFVSQAKTLVHEGVSRDIDLFYCAATADDLVYVNDLTAVARLVAVTAAGETLPDGEKGYLSAEIIKKHCADYRERIWYVSGPPRMVDAAVAILGSLGVSRRYIKQDFFPGLA